MSLLIAVAFFVGICEAIAQPDPPVFDPGEVGENVSYVYLAVSARPFDSFIRYGIIYNIEIEIQYYLYERIVTTDEPNEPISIGGADVVAEVCDHLVYVDRNNPNDRGRLIATSNMIEPHEDENGIFGTNSWSFAQILCLPFEEEGHAGQCSVKVQEHFFDASAIIWTALPDCGLFDLYYLTSTDSWTWICDSLGQSPTYPTPTVIIGAGGCWTGNGCLPVNFAQHIENLIDLGRQLGHTTVNMDTCLPPPPPQNGELIFTGYELPGGGDGWDWLPGGYNGGHLPDSIGLKFSIVGGHEGRFTFHISNISMWQGECLNSPRFTVPATPTGIEAVIPWDALEDTFPNFDFTVGNPQDYIYYVEDRLVKRRGYEPDNIHRRPGDTTIIVPPDGLPEDRQLFLTNLVATTIDCTSTHTLWLRAKDYAAHCLVTPVLVAAGKRSFLRGHSNPLTSDRLYTITVPRDYDGYEMPGVNYGDQLPDFWEEEEFGISGTPMYYAIRPFITVGSGPGHRNLIDGDDDPTGRDIDGDYFCNFEEYRGLMVAEDSTATWTGHRHQRLDPNRKSAIVHFRENIDILTSIVIPGYIYKCIGPEIFLTDSVRFGPTARWDHEFSAESKRDTTAWRDINFNKRGAGRWFVGYGLPTTAPIPDTSDAHAITFWRWNEVMDGTALPGRGSHHLRGATLWNPPPVFRGDSAQGNSSVPNRVKRCVVAAERIDRMQFLPFYQSNPGFFPDDELHALNKVIAHEFGHASGMLHPPSGVTSQSIMSNLTYDTIDTLGLHRLHVGDSTFSPQSIGQFSIKGSNP